MPALTEAGHDVAVRVLFQPSFHPEVCATFKRLGGEATFSLVTLQNNYRRREPQRWQKAQVFSTLHDRVRGSRKSLRAPKNTPTIGKFRRVTARSRRYF